MNTQARVLRAGMLFGAILCVGALAPAAFGAPAAPAVSTVPAAPAAPATTSSVPVAAVAHKVLSGGTSASSATNAAEAKPRVTFDCTKPAPYAPASAGASQLTVAIADNIIWQPKDGTVRFTITSTAADAIKDMEVRVCFTWPDPALKDSSTVHPALIESAAITTLERGSNYVKYGVSIPRELWEKPDAKFAPSFVDVWKDLFGQWLWKPRHQYDGWDMVPIVKMRVMARTQGTTDPERDLNVLDAQLPVGISFRIVALCWMLLVVAISWYLLRVWAQDRGVKGGWILRIIVNRDGYASLSQFQILLWTFVIGAGVVYVLALTGSILDVPAQELALLGISGFSALVAAYKTRSDQTAGDAGGQVTRTVVPVKSLEAVSVGDTSAVLFWQPSDPVVTAYVVDYVPGAAPPATAPVIASAGHHYAEISGLVAGTAYQFQVRASDRGTTSQPMTVTVTPQARPAAPSAPRLGVTIAADEKVPVLKISDDAVADAYIIQYREVGNPGWITGPDLLPKPAAVPFERAYPEASLSRRTNYEFRVAGVVNGTLSQWSPVVAAATTARIPRWSDLVVWDGQHEIDITRLQMLIFTALAAIFVAIKIGDESMMPTIPDGVVLLMGLTNGVYVGGKFIGKQT
jgi:hypothetical protein